MLKFLAESEKKDQGYKNCVRITNEWTEPLENLSDLEIVEFFTNLKKQIQKNVSSIPDTIKLRFFKIMVKCLINLDSQKRIELGETKFELYFAHDFDSFRTPFETYMNSHAVIFQTWLNPLEFEAIIVIFHALWNRNLFIFDEPFETVESYYGRDFNIYGTPSDFGEWVRVLGNKGNYLVYPKEEDLDYNKNSPQTCIHPKIETVQEFSRRIFGNDDRIILNYIQRRGERKTN